VVRALDHPLRIQSLQGKVREVKMTIRIGQRKMKLASALLRQGEAKYVVLFVLSVRPSARLAAARTTYWSRMVVSQSRH
jgi:hypothetical protein